MKIIFLDVQGTVSVGEDFSHDWVNFTPSCSASLSEIKKAVPDVKIVFISQIRHSDEGATMGRVRSFTRRCGWDWSEMLEPTPVRSTREDEIQAWLKDHPKVTHHVILDDNFVNLPEYIAVNRSTGLTLENAQQAIKQLTV